MTLTPIARAIFRYQPRFRAARLCAAFNDEPGKAKWLNDRLVLMVAEAKALLVGGAP